VRVADLVFGFRGGRCDKESGWSYESLDVAISALCTEISQCDILRHDVIFILAAVRLYKSRQDAYHPVNCRYIPAVVVTQFVDIHTGIAIIAPWLGSSDHFVTLLGSTRSGEAQSHASRLHRIGWMDMHIRVVHLLHCISPDSDQAPAGGTRLDH
jgi:hypothetical protein